MNDSHPWWLWPNLLSLDAPAVAVTWQVFLASVAGVAVPVAASAALALVVWGVYLADRGLDARRGAATSDRHRLAGRNFFAWALSAGAAIATAGVLSAVALPEAYLGVGCAVAAATAGYLALVHLARGSGALGRGLKEASVGVVFAAGVAVPLFAGAAPSRWLPGAASFAALCWLNCTLISVWEDGPASAPPPWLALAAGTVAVVAACAAQPPVRAAAIASAAALGLLHAARPRVSVRAARVLADAALLSPIAVAVWP